jgi:two-component system, NarL family, sensor kinase
MSLDSTVMVFFLGSSILMLFAFTLVIFLIVHKKKRFEHLIEKQQLENIYQNQLLQSRLEVQEQSFKYFSEEIHDNVGQVLSIAKMQLYSIRNNSVEKDTVTRANDCNDLLAKAIHDLRTISHTLNSSYVGKAGLVAAIEKEFEYIRSARGLKCMLHHEGEDYSLGSERELLTFRIIQEAIGNAVKHAAPTTIDIYLNYSSQLFKVQISDNGLGFDTNEQGEGIGLNNMHVRAGLLKGIINISSEREKGTKITFEMPVN